MLSGRLKKKIRCSRNRRRISREIQQGISKVTSLPYEIYYDPESRCNLLCIMCRITAERKRGFRRIPVVDPPLSNLERFTKLSPAIPFWGHVRLTGSGESLLCPDLPNILEICNQHHVKTSFATNGLFLDRSRSTMLIRHGLDELVISVDAASKTTYEKIRVGARWESLLEAIKTLNQVKMDLGSKKPRVIFSGNFARYNIEELPAFVDLAAGLGAAGVYIFKTILYDSNLKKYDLSHFPEITFKAYLEAMRRVKKHGLLLGNWLMRDVEFRKLVQPSDSITVSPGVIPVSRPAVTPSPAVTNEAPTGRGETSSGAGEVSVKSDDRIDPGRVLRSCQYPWTGLMIGSDGSVRVCCAESILLGHLDLDSFDEIWNGMPAKTLRKLFLQGRLPEGCKRCSEITKSNDISTTDAARTVSEWRGFLDHPGEGQVASKVLMVSGWFLDSTGIASVEIFVDGTLSGTARSNLDRPDVGQAHPQCDQGQQPGFCYRLNTTAMTDGCHLIHVRVLNSAGTVHELFHRTVRVRNEPDLISSR